MRFQLGAMSVGDILDRGIKLLFSRLGTFYAINLLVQSPILLYSLFAADMGASIGSLGALPMVLSTLGMVLLSMMVYAIGMAAVLKVVEQEYLDHKIGVGTALGFAFRRFVPLVAVSFIYGLVVSVGMIMCFIPGLIFMSMFAFASQAVVLEGVGPIKGMDRSEKLTRRYRWRIFGILILVGILNFMVSGVLNIGLQFVLPGTEFVRDAQGHPVAQIIFTNYLIDTVIVTLLNILITTYGTVCLTLAYFDLRVRKEGYDLEVAAQGEAPVAEVL
ncbi:MAG TPA: hypothetical protein VFA18_23240 [Gemmataceae bacterium]|nr:hypothetical protein [Gemmataceae bacterium]